jgi:hypothetical protein
MTDAPAHSTTFTARDDAIQTLAGHIQDRTGRLIGFHPDTAPTALRLLDAIPETTYYLDHAAYAGAQIRIDTGPGAGSLLAAAVPALGRSLSLVAAVPTAIGRDRLLETLHLRLGADDGEHSGKQQIYMIPSTGGEIGWPLHLAEAFDIVEPGFLADLRNRTRCGCGGCPAEPASQPHHQTGRQPSSRRRRSRYGGRR